MAQKLISIKWKSKKYESAVVKETKAAISRCARMVSKDAKKLLSVAGQTLPNQAGLNKPPKGKRFMKGKPKITGLGKYNSGGTFSGKNAETGEDMKIENVYWNSYEKKWTTASKPPAPPHKQTGHLRRSIGVQFMDNGLSARVGPRDDMKYGHIHEVGGKAGKSTLPARPYLLPAYNQNLSAMKKILSNAIIKAGSFL